MQSVRSNRFKTYSARRCCFSTRVIRKTIVFPSPKNTILISSFVVRFATTPWPYCFYSVHHPEERTVPVLIEKSSPEMSVFRHLGEEVGDLHSSGVTFRLIQTVSSSKKRGSRNFHSTRLISFLCFHNPGDLKPENFASNLPNFLLRTSRANIHCIWRRRKARVQKLDY